MSRLREHLVSLIAAEGPISVATYMQAVLAHYYAKSDPFGARGDFITAPEISQVFGELIGAWCVAVWEQLGSPPRFSLIELGPGRGTLMRDVLRAARVRPAFREAADVVFVELSPGLREQQREALRESKVRSVEWRDEFEAPAGQPLIVIANEFFDALPIEQFVMTHQRWRERRIGVGGNGELGFVLSPTALPRDSFPLASALCVEGAMFELGPMRTAVAERIGASITAQGGAALVIDYGFLGPAVGDTLQAMRGHKFESVLAEPGHADVTAHVDFAALAAGLVRGGADVYGPVAQGALLHRLGGRERTAALAARATPAQREALEIGYKRLTEDELMGSLFQALVAASPGLLPPGFGSHERR